MPRDTGVSDVALGSLRYRVLSIGQVAIASSPESRTDMITSPVSATDVIASPDSETVVDRVPRSPPDSKLHSLPKTSVTDVALDPMSVSINHVSLDPPTESMQGDTCMICDIIFLREAVLIDGVTVVSDDDELKA